MENPLMVSIFCMVYNHEPYLKDCLEGFLMQECNFSYQIVIGEDCSTDGSRAIIKEYAAKHPDKFKLLLHEKNVGAAENQRMVFENCTGKYIAICEGDDYWTDPLKLQKQVDFLEANQEVVMTYGNALIEDLTAGYHKEGSYIKNFETKTFTPDSIMSLGLPTLTMLFRNVLIFPTWFPTAKSGDLFIRLLLSQHGNFYYHGENFGVYRKHFGGLSRMNDKMDWNLNTSKNLKNFAAICLKSQKEPVQKAIAKHTIYAFYTSLLNKNPRTSFSIFVKCLQSKGFYTRQGFGLTKHLFKEVVIKKNNAILDIF